MVKSIASFPSFLPSFLHSLIHSLTHSLIHSLISHPSLHKNGDGIYNYTGYFRLETSQIPLLVQLLIRLNLITNLKVGPAYESHATLPALLHLLHILLDVLEGFEFAYFMA